MDEIFKDIPDYTFRSKINSVKMLLSKGCLVIFTDNNTGFSPGVPYIVDSIKDSYSNRYEMTATNANTQDRYTNTVDRTSFQIIGAQRSVVESTIKSLDKEQKKLEYLKNKMDTLGLVNPTDFIDIRKEMIGSILNKIDDPDIDRTEKVQVIAELMDSMLSI
jgi:hypothetical protein